MEHGKREGLSDVRRHWLMKNVYGLVSSFQDRHHSAATARRIIGIEDWYLEGSLDEFSIEEINEIVWVTALPETPEPTPAAGI